MASTTNIVEGSLPQEMQEHTYPIMYRIEETHWWFAGRRRIISGFVEHICSTLEKRPPHILDVGCGTGANLELLARYGKAEGVDVSPEALAFCRERGLQNVRQGEAEHLPYADDSFDLVTALDVVEHLDDDAAGLREMRRVLRPGGRALLFVPASMFLWGVQDDISHHHRRYTRAELTDAIKRAGLWVERSSYANITFFLPSLIGRLIMRVTGLTPESEANINLS